MEQNHSPLWEVLLYLVSGGLLAAVIAFFPKRWLQRWVKVWWLSPNALTLYGLLLTWAGTALYVSGEAPLLAYWLIVSGRSLDRVDGKMAVVRDQARKEAQAQGDPYWEQFPQGSTEVGKVIDPLADKLGWMPFIIGFAQQEPVSLVIAIIMAVNELAGTLLRPLPEELEQKLLQGKFARVTRLFSLGKKYARRRGATWFGKVKYAFQVFYVLANFPMDRGWFASPLWLLWVLLGLGTLLSFLSWISRMSLTPALDAQIDEVTDTTFGHGENPDD